MDKILYFTDKNKLDNVIIEYFMTFKCNCIKFNIKDLDKMELYLYSIVIFDLKINNYEYLRQLRSFSKSLVIILIINDVSQVIPALYYYPILFLSKNNLKNDLISLTPLLKMFINKKKYLLKNGTEILLDDIFYFKTEGKKILIVMERKSIEISGNIRDILNEEFKDFYMINRSTIINMKHVNKIEFPFVYLNNNLRCELSRRRKKDFEIALSNIKN